MRSKNILSLVLILTSTFSSFPVFSQNETITITTYYPAPFGVYREMRLYPNTSPSACNANNEGAMYYDNTTNQAMICRETSPLLYTWEVIGGGTPSGAIMMFTGACPSGWSRFTALDGRFPRGANAYGTTGGTTNHAHIAWTGDAQPYDRAFYANNCSGNWDGRFMYNLCWGAASDKYRHLHGVGVGVADNLPPYLDIIFCRKN